MNRLSEKFLKVNNNSTVTLEQDGVYEIFLRDRENVTIDGNGATVLAK